MSLSFTQLNFQMPLSDKKLLDLVRSAIFAACSLSNAK